MAPPRLHPGNNRTCRWGFLLIIADCTTQESNGTNAYFIYEELLIATTHIHAHACNARNTHTRSARIQYIHTHTYAHVPTTVHIHAAVR